MQKQMRSLFTIIIATLILQACNTSENNNSTLYSITSSNVLNLTDAKRILGEKAHQTDSTWTKGNITTCLCSFTANDTDSITNRRGVIYFFIEQYPSIEEAHKKYTDTKTANENNEGVKALTDFGDEAYFHSDKENFYFIMVRKANVVFNMKVNKITGNTSLRKFTHVAKEITNSIK